jgi:small GTP-binding protein
MDIKIEEVKTCSEETKYSLKIVIVGDSSVGKSNILTRYCSDTFTKEGQATIGVELDNKIFKVNNDLVNVSIWDTAGQERFKSITTAYYRGSQGIIIVFDLTRFDTFEHVKDWFSEVKKSASSDTQCLLIGNKSDLTELRKVTSENGTDLSKELGNLF